MSCRIPRQRESHPEQLSITTPITVQMHSPVIIAKIKLGDSKRQSCNPSLAFPSVRNPTYLAEDRFVLQGEGLDQLLGVSAVFL